MKPSDWIALGQALLLAAAAFAAWRAYALAVAEHREERFEARKAPLRVLFADVVRELKDLAHQAEERVPGIGVQRIDLVTAHQRRLNLALTFMPPDIFNLFATRELTTCAAQDVNADAVHKASQELLRLFTEIERGQYSIEQVALPSMQPRPPHPN